MKTNLHQAYPIVAAALGRRLGVRVEIHGDRARTNGDVIQLPATSDESTDYREVAWGFLAHEAAHLRWTDFEVFQSAGTLPIRQSLLNVIEDIRIERNLVDLYPGTRRSLETTVGRVLLEGGFALPSSSARPGVHLQAFCLLDLRSRILGQKILAPLAQMARDQLETVIGSKTLGLIDVQLRDVTALSSTGEALDLVDRLLALFRAPSDATPKQASTGEAKGSSRPEVRNKRTSVEEDDGASQDGSDRVPFDLDGTPSGELIDDLFAMAGSFLDRRAEGANGPTLPVADDPPALGKESHALLAKVRRESLHLRSSLESLVQASVERRQHHGHHGLVIDGHRLARSAVMDPKIFLRRNRRIQPDTAVHLLVDRSPSMSALVARPQGGSARRIDLAWEASLALALALEAIPGVNPAITTFPGEMGESSRVYRVLPHGRRLNEVRDHLGSDLDGSTPLAEALLYGASELIGTGCQRKLILCLTDGIPDDLEAAIAILAQIRASGIAVHGIGLALDVDRVFGPSITIADLGELRSALFDLCRTLLTVPH